jgi:hypothetical protein
VCVGLRGKHKTYIAARWDGIGNGNMPIFARWQLDWSVRVPEHKTGRGLQGLDAAEALWPHYVGFRVWGL